MLPDIIYVDEARLKQHVERIAEPMKYVKVPIWKVELGLLGPKVSGQQDRLARPLTRDEKIELLGRYLLSNNELGQGRLTDRSIFSRRERVFREETCRATKVRLPVASPEALVPRPREVVDDDLHFGPRIRNRRPGQDLAEFKREGKRRWYENELTRVGKELLGFEGINVWISDVSAAQPASLFLIEDFSGTDESTYRAVSAYSAMVVMFDELAREFKKTILFSLASSNALRNPESEFQKRFVSDPIGALTGVGGRVMTTRNINVVYHIRATVLYTNDGRETVGTIAYPIVIMDAG